MHPDNARGVLAAACLLGGMDELCEFAYDVCRRHISLDNIGSWLDFVEIPDTTSGSATPLRSGTPMLPGTPTMATPPPLPQPTTLFGLYTQRLRSDVFNFLVVTLPASLDLSDTSQNGSEPSGRDVLMQIFAQVPFELFKSAVESPTFQIGKFTSYYIPILEGWRTAPRRRAAEPAGSWARGRSACSCRSRRR